MNDPRGGWEIPYPLHEAILKMCYRNDKIKIALGGTHFVKKNRLYRKEKK